MALWFPPTQTQVVAAAAELFNAEKELEEQVILKVLVIIAFAALFN